MNGVLTEMQVMAKIDEEMRARKLSQKALAERIGVSPSSVCLSLSGARPPTPRILKYFGFERTTLYRRAR